MISHVISDYAIHSDFLIHWTGKDIDCEHDRDWYSRKDEARIGEEAENKYLRRLRDILTFGLWMTEEAQCTLGDVVIPATPKCCFTELKISESRKHASQYGRLGIGVKRPFLFRRYGRPLAYCGFHEKGCDDKFLKACADDFKNKNMLNFFKTMNSSAEFTYDVYGESEWRLLFFDELLREGKIIDPRDMTHKREHKYFLSLTHDQQQKLKYLIPLDGWFSMIIYPSSSVRIRAQQNSALTIGDAIRRIKSDPSDHGNRAVGGSWPIEVTVGDCRHF